MGEGGVFTAIPMANFFLLLWPAKSCSAKVSSKIIRCMVHVLVYVYTHIKRYPLNVFRHSPILISLLCVHDGI